MSIARLRRFVADMTSLVSGAWQDRDDAAIVEVEVLSLAEGDIHQAANALADGNSLSIRVYGANIGALRRQRFDPASGAASEYVSGYANRELPNIWDRFHVPLPLAGERRKRRERTRANCQCLCGCGWVGSTQ